jgi:hypothetical protein
LLIINRYSKKHLELFLTTVLIEGHEAFHKQGMTVPPPAWKAFSVLTWNVFSRGMF